MRTTETSAACKQARRVLVGFYTLTHVGISLRPQTDSVRNEALSPPAHAGGTDISKILPISF